MPTRFFSEFGGTAKASTGRRLAAADADGAQRDQADDARNIGVGPAAGIRPGGRRIVAEIGREQHGAREQVLDRRARDAQRKAAAGGMADQRQRRCRRGLANDRDEIGEVIFELADIADVAAGARRAMAANVDRKGFHAARRQRVDSAWMVPPLEPEEPCTTMAARPVAGPIDG